MSNESDRLRDLAQRLISDPDSAATLSKDDMDKVHRHLHPLGSVITGKKKFANMSIINWRAEYYKKLIVTGFAGYLYTVAGEYVPEKDIAAANRDLEATITFIKTELADDPAKQDKFIAKARKEHAERVKLMTTTSRGIITRFLDRHLEYNPDLHVRKAAQDNKVDGKNRAEEIERICKNASAAEAINKKLSAQPEKMFTYMRDNMLATRTYMNETLDALKPIINTLSHIKSLDQSIADAHGIMLKKYTQIKIRADDLAKVIKPIAEVNSLAMWKRNPPVDVFHQFNRYFVNHFEQCSEVVASLYNERPDIEFAVIFYDCHDSEEEARQYRVAHESDFRADVFGVENVGVTLLGPYRENRDKLDYYNKNTEILRLMQSQVEADHHLGKDIMEKQVKKKKAENIRENGPDAIGLQEYARATNVVQDLGVKKILSPEEQLEMHKAQSVIADAECPDEGIQVDVFYPTQDGELKKRVFYTQSESPLHMQEGSQYIEKYQPKRDAPLLDSYKTKLQKDEKTGKTVEIRVPKEDVEKK